MQQTLSGRNALSLAGLTVLSALLFLICTCERTNPIDSHNPNYIPPSITIDTTGSNVSKGDSITTDSVTITVTGNRTQSIFRAHIDSAVWSAWGAAGVFGYDSLTSGRHVVSIESKYEGGDFVVSDSIVFFVRSGINSVKALTAFSFANPAVTGTINETAKTVTVTVPFGTNATALAATFSTTGSSVKVGSVVQVSGTTANNFTSSIIYTVTAGDNSTQDYVVTVTISLNTAKALTAFSFANPAVTGTINETAKTVAVTVPFGTNVTALAATFSTTGSSVKVGSVGQASGTTTNNFATPIIYTITAGDSSTQDYTVTVTKSLNTAKALTAFRFTNLPDTGIINDTNKTVRVTVPYGTDVRTLAAIFSTTGASVKVGSVVQMSGTTTNDFASQVTYTVTAGDNSTQDYKVTVTKSLNTAKALTAFKFANLSEPGIIDTNNNTVKVTVPFGTNVSNLAATFSTNGASVKISGVTQTSGETANNFSNPVAYTITAADNSTQAYVVTVSAAAPSSNATLSALSVNQSSISPAFSSTTLSYAVTVVNTVTSITITGTRSDATATLSSNNGVPQNLNVGNNTITIRVTAQDGTTIKDYVVTVTRAPTPVTFLSVVQVGGTSNVTTTTALTLSFDVDPTNLAASDITVTGATKGALTGTGLTRTLAISAITVANGATVSVAVSSPAGFTITGTPQTAVVYKAPIAITLPAIAGVTAPVRGATPVTTITPTAQYTGTVSWAPLVATTFIGEQVYTATITLTALSGFTLSGVAQNFFTVTGATSVTNPANSGVVTAVFPKTGSAWTVNGNTLIDPDLNTYTTVTIGTQVWTVENLKTTKYSDGTSITKDTSAATWGTFTTNPDSGKYCWYNNDSATYKNPYGALYNWYVVKPANLKHIAPAGWHVPTDADWATLSTHLGGESVAGGQMKEAGLAHWASPNTDASNSSGFSALPGGVRYGDGTFSIVGVSGSWWSATAFDASGAYERVLYYEYSNLFRYDYGKSCGFSVRLVRD